MKLYPIEAGNFKLDGGAMFGVVPKTLWEQTNPADEKNRIEMASRCLLVEEGDKLILIDTGMGAKQENSFFRHYSLWGDNSLESSLAKEGFHPDDITDVFLTHLHFDHCGGAISKTKDGSLETAFKNAAYWSNKEHWGWATSPNKREVASFLKENILPIKESGHLQYIEKESSSYLTGTPLGFDALFVDGHTEKQMVPIINFGDKKIAYAADLVPTHGHIPLPYIMGYDVRPLLSLDEKEKFLNHCYENNIFLLFEHDPNIEVASLLKTDKGVRIDKKLNLSELF